MKTVRQLVNNFQGGDEKETHERAASLVVLPPLVLGYEELYVDNDDNQPAKKDMDYPNEVEENKATETVTVRDDVDQTDETEQSGKADKKKSTTKQTKETEKESTKHEDKKDKKEDKKDKKKENKEKTSDSKDKKKKMKKEDKKKDNKKTTKKDTKKDNKKKTTKHNKKDKKKEKGKKKGKRQGKFQSSQSRSESNSENSDDSQSESALSDLDTIEINNLQELLNNQPSVYGVERIYPTLPTRAGRMPTGSFNNFNLDLGLSNHGYTSNKAMIFKNRITNQTPLINDKTYVMGLNLNSTTSSLNKLISLLSRRMSASSVLKDDKKTVKRSGDDKGVITLKGQGEIGEGEGKEVLDFTGNFRVPKKVLDCPCFKEILEKEEPSF